jgi:hypothetical protein
MKIGELLSTVRVTIKEITDDSRYTNSYLCSIIVQARATILGNSIKGKSYISNWSSHTFCVELELVKAEDCDCVTDTICKVLRSKYKIPRPLIGRYRDAIQIKLLDGRLVGMIEQYQLKSDSLDPIKGQALRYSIINQYLYVWRSKTLKCIYVDGIWENILDWQDIQSQEDCNDIYELESGIGHNEVTGIMQIIATLLQLPLTRKDDDSDDRNPEIR